MEYCVNNNHINKNIELSIFIQRLMSKNSPKESLEIWQEVPTMSDDHYWSMVSDAFSNIDNCIKIVKSLNRNEDIILFVSSNTSSRHVAEVMDVYSDLIISNDKYFDILVLDKEQYRSWENNENNIVYWESTN